MEQKANSFLETERLGRLMAKYAVPCVISLLVAALYNIVDQIFVGNGVGYLGNAATGVIFPITVIGWGVSLFFGDGAAASLSVSLGKNETEDIHRSVGNSILFSFLGGLAIILISYVWGDGTAGKRIGQLVAEKLGIPCYYKEMTALAAQESGLAKEFISGINSDENAVMRELYLSTSAVQQAVIPQDKAINMIADSGSCVIVGRAADYVLRDRENVVRIFIHAPKEYRVKKVMEMYGDTAQEGRELTAPCRTFCVILF